MSLRETGTSGSSSGFTLGPEQNEFGNSGSTRTLSETLRDDYGTANASWLAEYDANSSLGIYIVYNDNGNTVAEGQTRVNSTWTTTANFIGIRGEDGGAVNLANVSNGHIPVKSDTGDAFEDSQIIRLADGTILFEQTLRTQNASIDVGNSVRFSEFGSLPSYNSLLSGRRYLFPIEQYNRSTGISEMERFITPNPLEQTFSIQPVDTQTMLNPDNLTMISTGDRFVNEIRFNLVDPVVGLVVRLKNSSGDVIKHLPNERAWRMAEDSDYSAGFNLSAGLQTIDISVSPIITSTLEDTTPPFKPQIDYTIEFLHDGDLTVLGDGTIPFMELIGHEWELRRVLDSDDLNVNYINPNITSFDIQNQHTQVDSGTTLSGSILFDYSMVGSTNVDGNLELLQGGTVLASNISPSETGTITQAINSVTLNNGESVVFTLRGTDTRALAFSRTFTVRARVQNEALYYGVLSDVVPANIDETTLTEHDVLAGTVIQADFDIPNTEYAVILSPADREITSIIERTFNQESLSTYTKTENAKTINSQQYDLYTHQNNSGVQGILSTTIRIG